MTAMQRTHLEIIVGTEFDFAFNRGMLRGILDYAGDKSHWLVKSAAPSEAAMLQALESKPDGLISYALTPSIIAAAKSACCPVVPMMHSDLKLVGVNTDDEAIGKMAADHLLELGLKHFASAIRGDDWAIIRSRAFAHRIQQAGYPCREFDLPSDTHLWSGGILDLDNSPLPILEEIPRPLGLFAGNDVNGYRLIHDCLTMGLRVPDDVAIIGVDNDDIFCNACRPQLSSVIANHRQVGYHAAELLDKMLKEEDLPEKSILVFPGGVERRKSTDVLAVADAEIVQAVRYIRDHVEQGITPKLLMQEIPLGRRSFESRFKSAMGCTVLEEIVRSRINRAKELLGKTDMPMPKVAEKSGFADYSRLAVVFKQKTELTPTQYRNQSRQRPAM